MILGRVVGLFGVRGWIKVFSYTDPREAVLQYKGWMLGKNEQWQPVKVAEGKRQGKSVIARLEGVDNREAAEVLVGKEIRVSKESMPEPDEGQYYWSDLIGLKVVHRDGTELGKIDYMLETGANDVMVLKGEKERLIPFVVDRVVLNVDLAAGQVDVDWEWD
ncbi:MAG: ribosome maturation factor RimM [Gammaproteobacteria bacterium]|nr:ribosome maturation factor RimM [Gammaproteobacteria bacterium]